jgi:methyl-accepting chemotaxis protein
MKHLSITQRLALIVGLLVLTIAGIVAGDSMSFRASMMQERRDKMRDMVDGAIAMMKYYDAEASAGRLSLEEAQARARAAIRAFRWGNNDYFALNRFDGMTLSHANPKFENVNRFDFVDASGVHTVEATINAAKAGGGQLNFVMPRAGETVPAAKVLYAAGYLPWQWAISAGAYIDDVDAAVLNRLVWVAGLATLATMLAAGLAMFIARSISRPIATLCHTMQTLADGDIRVTVPFTTLRHETGEIARTVDLCKTSMVEGERLRQAQEELKRQGESEKKILLNKMADDFENGVRA